MGQRDALYLHTPGGRMDILPALDAWSSGVVVLNRRIGTFSSRKETGRDHDDSDPDERRQTDKRKCGVWERRRVEIRSDNCIALQPGKGKDTRSAQVQNE
jgi:hypothetical protein